MSETLVVEVADKVVHEDTFESDTHGTTGLEPIRVSTTSFESDTYEVTARLVEFESEASETVVIE